MICHVTHVQDFNPRSREGSDISWMISKSNLFDFNPRSREGSDNIAWLYYWNIPSISIHAPARGATQFTVHRKMFRTYFNPRSREGSDVTNRISFAQYRNFNPRSREGSDTTRPSTYGMRLNFNPRSREGSDSIRH